MRKLFYHTLLILNKDVIKMLSFFSKYVLGKYSNLGRYKYFHMNFLVQLSLGIHVVEWNYVIYFLLSCNIATEKINYPGLNVIVVLLVQISTIST